MNRKQAESILDAYVLLETTKMQDASKALKDVILDAMTETRYYPTITYPSRLTEPYKPYVTWTTESGSTVCANGHERVEVRDE